MAKEEQRLIPKVPDDVQIGLYFETLGRAISAWQTVEMQLCEIYRQTIAPQVPGAATSAFYALQAFYPKLNVVTAALRFRLADNGDLWTYWNKDLKKEAQDRSRQRNNFAHLATFILLHEQEPEDQIRLAPHLADHRNTGDIPKLGVKEIAKSASEFDELARKLSGFAREVALLKIP